MALVEVQNVSLLIRRVPHQSIRNLPTHLKMLHLADLDVKSSLINFAIARTTQITSPHNSEGVDVNLDFSRSSESEGTTAFPNVSPRPESTTTHIRSI